MTIYEDEAEEHLSYVRAWSLGGCQPKDGDPPEPTAWSAEEAREDYAAAVHVAARMKEAETRRQAMTTQTSTPLAPPPKPKAMTLAGIRKGRIDSPMRVLIYGPEGSGKSTWCAGAPRPIFLGADGGTVAIDCDRLPEPKTWQDVLDAIALVGNERHEYQSLVVDPLGWVEALVFDSITGGTCSIDKWDGGYGRGVSAAGDQWRLAIKGLERCWLNGMNILLTAHSTVKTFANPEGASYDRFEVAMNPKAAGVFKQWVDFVLFARIESFAKAEKGQAKGRGFTTGARVTHTVWSAAYDAKTRYKLPETLPLAWDAFFDAVQAEKGRAEELGAAIAAMLAELDDAAVTRFSAEYLVRHRGNADRLAELANRVGIKCEEKRNASTQGATNA